MLSILQALDAPALFGRAFPGPTWGPWRAFLAALFALPLSDGQLEVFRKHTGREAAPTEPASECFAIVGRRGGKSRIAALVAVYLACLRTYRFALGERGVVMVIATDRQQARVIFNYIVALIEGSPLLARMVRRRTAEVIELRNGIDLAVHAASFRSVRGYTLVGDVLDELAFWRSEDSAAPDSEIINALRPAMATVPGALLLGISSPYARRGVLWSAYREHWAKPDSRTLVWQAPSRSMNSTISESVIRRAFDEDPAAAAAEWAAQFRTDVESFVSREAIERCVVFGRLELEPRGGVAYRAFCDPSGGSSDSFAWAIAHSEEGKTVLDLVREVRPPFSPEAVVADCVADLQRYGVGEIEADRYAGEWVAERFRVAKVLCVQSAKPKSDLYRELLGPLNSGNVELPDHARLVAQLASLERRTARGGRDSIDHAPNAHNDLANVVAGVVSRARTAEQKAERADPILRRLTEVSNLHLSTIGRVFGYGGDTGVHPEYLKLTISSAMVQRRYEIGQITKSEWERLRKDELPFEGWLHTWVTCGCDPP